MFHSINPVNNQVLKSFPTLSDTELEDKLSWSKSTFDSFWKDTAVETRIQSINKVIENLKENTADYAKLITLEMGKPITQSLAEIEKCIFLCEYYCKNAKVFLEDKIVETAASKSYVTYQPLGAVFGIMPWNFPFWQVFRYSIPNILAGNVVLLKHAPNVPQCALAIEKIFSNAVDKKGVFQSLFIEIDQVEKVISNKIVQGVTLTGSDRAGSSVAALAGKHIKKCVLELGGTDAFIVLKDADLEKAAHLAIKSRMNNCGQTCISAKRIIVDEIIADRFTALLSKEISNLKMGDPFDPKTEISCLARPDLVETLERQINSSIDQGAVVVKKGGRSVEGGNYFELVILTNIKREMAVYKEEVFGPVAVVLTFNNEKEAINLANDSDYGLGAAVWSNDLERAEKIGLKLEAGAIAINDMVKSDPRLPFGGVKRSGFGRELALEGIREFVNIKSVSMF
jgi:succinate-semialdehyde dehydrogenase/glutarate-semialdehyde dehydrogenase